MECQACAEGFSVELMTEEYDRPKIEATNNELKKRNRQVSAYVFFCRLNLRYCFRNSFLVPILPPNGIS